MSVNRSLASVLTVLATLTAGCTPQIDAYDAARIRATRNAGAIETRRQVVVATVDPAGNAPEADVRAMAQAVGSLGEPQSTHAVVSGAGTDRTRRAALRYLDRFGIPRANVVFSGEAASGPALTVSLTRFTVTPAECPAWGDLLENYVSNAPTIPLGCANTRNFQMMVQDPRDLVVGRALEPSLAKKEAAGVQRYMEDKVRPLPRESASDVYKEGQK
ncbi:CpaD family pilus assembly lipoprotein [Azospirillum sp.]|uniref:CpaD family pilus assembly lipoprotein n=1 Tax=Azospirillum sp. TaxID=34012 RepID=UPI003D71E288